MKDRKILAVLTHFVVRRKRIDRRDLRVQLDNVSILSCSSCLSNIAVLAHGSDDVIHECFAARHLDVDVFCCVHDVFSFVFGVQHFRNRVVYRENDGLFRMNDVVAHEIDIDYRLNDDAVVRVNVNDANVRLGVVVFFVVIYVVCVGLVTNGSGFSTCRNSEWCCREMREVNEVCS